MTSRCLRRPARILAVLALSTAGVAVANNGDAATVIPSVHACADAHAHLALSTHGKCARGRHPVTLPLSAIPGARGPRGATGAVPTTLASGKALAGVWSTGFSASAKDQYTTYAVPFRYPFAAAPVPELVVEGEPSTASKYCAGTAAAPVAAPGYVCIYAQTDENANYAEPESALTGQIASATRFGWALAVGSSAAGTTFLDGSWAATAP